MVYIHSTPVRKLITCVLIVLQAITICGSTTENTANLVITETSSGKIVGRKEGNINTYLGIPYAEPPVGSYRFRPPRPKTPWYPAMYRALNFGPECLQSALYRSDPEEEDPDSVGMDEDCLYLNIWQPAKAQQAAEEASSKPLLPVMIWIYGGAFLHGSANKPEYIGNKLASSRNVLVVSLNYRVGALGFLVSTADGLYGNYGLDDQKTAIQWVKSNILHFGGDPNRITLFGESAGAMSIGLHMLDQEQRTRRGYRSHTGHSDHTDDDGGTNSDEHGGEDESYSKAEYRDAGAQKLFDAVILQSNPLGYKYRSISVANFIGISYKEYLDCEDLRCLQNESPEELMHVQDTLMAVPRSIGDFFTWGPVITDTSYYREVRLRPGPIANVTVVQPMEALKQLHRLDVPILMGTNTHEGTVFVFTAYPTRMTKIVYQALVFSFFRASAPKILRIYAPLTKILSQSAYPDYRLVLSRIIGDYLFRCPNHYFAAQLAATGAAVYHYEFALATRTPGFPCCDGLACHTSELPYVFNQLGVIEADYSWQDASTTTSTISTASTTSTTAGSTTSSSFSVPVDLDPNRLVPGLASSGTTSASSGGGHGYGESAGAGTIAAESVGSGTADSLLGGLLSHVALPEQLGTSTLASSAPPAPPAMVNTSIPRTSSPRGARSDGYAFPDIFGAASGWLSGAGAHAVHTAGLRGKVPRSVVDAEVSRIMAEFWTTFAAYGDPNGQPAHSNIHSNIHSKVKNGHTSGAKNGRANRDLNGYVAGSCAVGVPWWPRLLGDIPSRQEIREMQRRASTSTARESIDSDSSDGGVSGTWHRGNSYGTSQHPGSEDTSQYSDSAEDRTTHDSQATGDEEHSGGSAEYNAPTIRSTLGHGDSSWAKITVHPTPRKSPSKHTDRSVYANSGSNEVNSELICRYTRKLRSAVTKYMHHMVFDEDSSVNIIQNDCICNQWNMLEYRF